MFDDLLDNQRHRFTLIQWAEKGWLSTIEELSPFYIAFLCFPYFHDQKQTDPAVWKSQRQHCLALSDSIQKAAEAGELKSRTVNWNEHRWPFYEESHRALTKALIERSNRPQSGGLVHGDWSFARRDEEEPLRRKQPCSPPDIRLIHRNDFGEWLQCKGQWPIKGGGFNWFMRFQNSICL